jgi:hypothetical protein
MRAERRPWTCVTCCSSTWTRSFGKRCPRRKKARSSRRPSSSARASWKSGVYQAGDPLHPISTATTVRIKNGKTIITDGPYAETKEQLGGYNVVEAKDLDEALAIAARHPLLRGGFSIEVRPIRVGPPR